MATIQGIYVSDDSAAPIQSLITATLIRQAGIEGDRYALRKGTYSAKFIDEPGRNLTMVSADGLETEMKKIGMESFDLGMMRRNIVLRGITSEGVNDMVGHEVKIGSTCRLFVHRRCVPCKYREAHLERPGFMNKLWDFCGVNCEVIEGGIIHIGDIVGVIPGTYQPTRANKGFKPPAFFIRPSERTLQQAQQMVIQPLVAGMMCLVDPVGFQRLENGYNSVGQKFWSPDAYRVGSFVKRVRTPLFIIAGIAASATVVKVIHSATTKR